MLDNKTYDVLKWVVLVFLPALVALVSGLGGAFGWDNTELATTVIGLFTVFLGSLLGISTNKYNQKNKE